MTIRLLATLLSTAAVLLLGGCHIENHGEHDFTDFDEADSGTVCASFCNRLFSCGNIGPGQYGVCVEGCQAKFTKDEMQTRKGCKCVANATCVDSGSYACPGAPLPPATPPTAGNSPDAGSSAPDAGSSAPDTSTPEPDASPVAPPKAYTCKQNADCVASEDCVAGYCLVRCKASCECHLGEVCQSGYCSLPIAPAKSCAADCDCPSGGKCVSGKCQ